MSRLRTAYIYQATYNYVGGKKVGAFNKRDYQMQERAASEAYLFNRAHTCTQIRPITDVNCPSRTVSCIFAEYICLFKSYELAVRIRPHSSTNR